MSSHTNNSTFYITSAEGRKFSGHPLVQRIWGINGFFERKINLLGLESSLFNPFTPQIRCTRGWPENFRPPALDDAKKKM